ncbi:MAG: helix-turn-helix domain-containing protein [Treponema sp.]|nr:helix-turn-helix domain-containing protein [Treponema sp.]
MSPAKGEEIAIALEQGQSLRSIARSLGRSPSSVCREVQRNGPPLNKAADRPRRSRAKERPAALRSKPMRHTRPSGWKSGGSRIPNRVDLSERPPQAGTEKQAGRREADAVVSRESRAGTAVLAGRKMRFFIAARMKDKTARGPCTGRWQGPPGELPAGLRRAPSPMATDWKTPCMK